MIKKCPQRIVVPALYQELLLAQNREYYREGTVTSRQCRSNFRSGLTTDGSTAPPSVSEARLTSHAANDVHLKPTTRAYCGGGVVVVVVWVCSGWAGVVVVVVVCVSFFIFA